MNIHILFRTRLSLLALMFSLTTASYAESDQVEHRFGYVKTFGLTNDTNRFSDIVNDVETDLSGNVYQSGAFRFTVDFDPTNGTHTVTSGYYNDAYVSKTNADGSFAWVWRTEGRYGAYATSATADDQGNVFISGYFNGLTDFDPDPNTTVMKNSRHSWDAFYVKLDESGNFIWVKTLNGNRDEYVKDIAIDKDGNIYLVGYYNATIIDFDPGYYTIDLQSILGYTTLFVTKINADGTYGWTHRSGRAPSRVYGLKIETGTQPDGVSDVIYVTGNFTGTVDFDANDRDEDGNLHTVTSNGSKDGFIFQLDDQGQFNWLRTIGGKSVDRILDVHTSNADVYITGTTINAVSFGDGSRNEILGTPGGRNVFYSQFNSDGSYVQTKILPSISPSMSLYISTDIDNNIFIAGTFSKTTDFYSGPDNLATEIHQVIGRSNIYISKYSPTGDSIWTKIIGVNGRDSLRGMSLSSGGELVLTGVFSNTVDFDPNQENKIEITAAGYRDIYLLLLTQKPDDYADVVYGSDEDKSPDINSTGPTLTPGSIQPGFNLFNLQQ